MRFNIPSSFEEISGDKDAAIVDRTSNKHERSIVNHFLLLEENKERLQIEFYTISPSAFDEVFLRATEKHHIGEEEVPNKAKMWYRHRLLTGA
jgi:ATP-binding cassette subfamily A (ABC1) protein 3